VGRLRGMVAAMSEAIIVPKAIWIILAADGSGDGVYTCLSANEARANCRDYRKLGVTFQILHVVLRPEMKQADVTEEVMREDPDTDVMGQRSDRAWDERLSEVLT